MRFLALILLLTSSICSATVIETGSKKVNRDITLGKWSKVKLKNQFEDPIIIASLGSDRNYHPITYRIRNITKNSFEIGLQSPCASVGACKAKNSIETIHYTAIERGTWTLESGAVITADSVTTNNVSSNRSSSYITVELPSNHKTQPAIIHSVATTNDIKFASSTSKQLPPNQTSQYVYGLSLELGETGFLHKSETISYIAISSGTHKTDIGNIYSYSTIGLRGICTPLIFYGIPYNQITHSSVNSRNWSDGSFIRYCNTLLNSGVTLDEDQVGDNERFGLIDEINIISFPTGDIFVEPKKCEVDTIIIEGEGNGIACDNLPLYFSAKPYCSGEGKSPDNWDGEFYLSSNVGELSKSKFDFKTSNEAFFEWSSKETSMEATITAEDNNSSPFTVIQPNISFSPEGLHIETKANKCDNSFDLNITAYGKTGNSCTVLTDLNSNLTTSVSSNLDVQINEKNINSNSDILLTFNNGVSKNTIEFNESGDTNLTLSSKYGKSLIYGQTKLTISPLVSVEPDESITCSSSDTLCLSRFQTNTDYSFELVGTCSDKKQPLEKIDVDMINISTDVTFPTDCGVDECNQNFKHSLDKNKDGSLTANISFQDVGNYNLNILYEGDNIGSHLFGTVIPYQINQISNLVSFDGRCEYTYFNHENVNLNITFEALGNNGQRTSNFNHEFNLAKPDLRRLSNNTTMEAFNNVFEWEGGVSYIEERVSFEDTENQLNSLDNSVLITRFKDLEGITLLNGTFSSETWSDCEFNCDSFKSNDFKIKKGRAVLNNTHGRHNHEQFGKVLVDWFYDGVPRTSAPTCEFDNLKVDSISILNILSGQYTEQPSFAISTGVVSYPAPSNFDSLIKLNTELDVPEYLEWDWNNDGLKTNPTNTVTFGQHAKDRKIISWEKKQ